MPTQDSVYQPSLGLHAQHAQPSLRFAPLSASLGVRFLWMSALTLARGAQGAPNPMSTPFGPMESRADPYCTYAILPGHTNSHSSPNAEAHAPNRRPSHRLSDAEERCATRCPEHVTFDRLAAGNRHKQGMQIISFHSNTRRSSSSHDTRANARCCSRACSSDPLTRDE